MPKVPKVSLSPVASYLSAATGQLVSPTQTAMPNPIELEARYILTNVLGVKADDPVSLSSIHKKILMVADLYALNNDVVSQMRYPHPDTGNIEYLKAGEQILLHIIRYYKRYRAQSLNPIKNWRTDVKPEDVNAFRISNAYDFSVDVAHTRSAADIRAAEHRCHENMVKGIKLHTTPYLEPEDEASDDEESGEDLDVEESDEALDMAEYSEEGLDEEASGDEISHHEESGEASGEEESNGDYIDATRYGAEDDVSNKSIGVVADSVEHGDDDNDDDDGGGGKTNDQPMDDGINENEEFGYPGIVDPSVCSPAQEIDPWDHDGNPGTIASMFGSHFGERSNVKGVPSHD